MDNSVFMAGAKYLQEGYRTARESLRTVGLRSNNEQSEATGQARPWDQAKKTLFAGYPAISTPANPLCPDWQASQHAEY